MWEVIQSYTFIQLFFCSRHNNINKVIIKMIITSPSAEAARRRTACHYMKATGGTQYLAPCGGKQTTVTTIM